MKWFESTMIIWVWFQLKVWIRVHSSDMAYLTDSSQLWPHTFFSCFQTHKSNKVPTNSEFKSTPFYILFPFISSSVGKISRQQFLVHQPFWQCFYLIFKAAIPNSPAILAMFLFNFFRQQFLVHQPFWQCFNLISVGCHSLLCPRIGVPSSLLINLMSTSLYADRPLSYL